MALFQKGEGGRPKGATNKFTRDMREMIFQAFENAGGVEYLTTQAAENPVAFMALLGKIVPKEVALTVDESLAERIAERRKRAIQARSGHVEPIQ